MKETGTVKWFNNSRVLASSAGKTAPMSSCITAPSRARAFTPWRKNKRWNLRFQGPKGPQAQNVVKL